MKHKKMTKKSDDGTDAISDYESEEFEKDSNPENVSNLSINTENNSQSSPAKHPAFYAVPAKCSETLQTLTMTSESHLRQPASARGRDYTSMLNSAQDTESEEIDVVSDIL